MTDFVIGGNTSNNNIPDIVVTDGISNEVTNSGAELAGVSSVSTNPDLIIGQGSSTEQIGSPDNQFGGGGRTPSSSLIINSQTGATQAISVGPNLSINSLGNIHTITYTGPTASSLGIEVTPFLTKSTIGDIITIDGSQIGTKLDATTLITAGSYGNSSSFISVTVDQYGRVSNIETHPDQLGGSGAGIISLNSQVDSSQTFQGNGLNISSNSGNHTFTAQLIGTNGISTGTSDGVIVLDPDGARQNVFDVLREPTGFLNRTDSSITFNTSSRLFELSGSHSYYIQGTRYYGTGGSYTVGTDYGTTFFYYNNNGVFTASTIMFNFETDAVIAYVWWDPLKLDGFVGEERHGCTMDLSTHNYLHNTQGAVIKTGFPISGYTLNSNGLNENTYSIGTGQFFDEDILNQKQTLVDGGPYTIFYKNGIQGNWSGTKGLNLPILTSANGIQYNTSIGGTWINSDISPSNRYVNYYVFTTNAVSGTSWDYIIVPGQTLHTTQASAEGESVTSLDRTSLPFLEFAPLYKVTYFHNSGYSSVNGKAQIISVSSLIGQKFTVNNTTSTPLHNSLPGLQGGTTSEYYHLTSEELSVATKRITQGTGGIHVGTVGDTVTISSTSVPSSSLGIQGTLGASVSTAGDTVTISGGMKFLGHYTISTSASAGTIAIPLTGVASQFNDFKIRFWNVKPAGDGSEISLLVSTTYPTQVTSGYGYISQSYSVTEAAGDGADQEAYNNGSASAGSIIIGRRGDGAATTADPGNATVESAQGTIEFSEPFNSARFKVLKYDVAYVDTTGNAAYTRGVGFSKSATALQGIIISGANTSTLASGTAALYALS